MSAVIDDAAREVVAAAFRAHVKIYETMGTPLYAEFSRHAADNPEMLDLASHGMEGSRATHLFSGVHYLLLGDPSHPLARYFATLTDDPMPPEGSYPELAAFCREHRDTLVEIMRTRSVQTTYAERCRAILAPMGAVARAAGEPLNLVEIGCSAGVLLVFDKFAYRMNGQGVVGEPDAPLLLQGELQGDAELFIPQIGRRTGLDLHTIDASAEEERRWLLALCFPELRDEQARLARALDVIAATDITLYEGDALQHLATAMAQAPDPLCVYHSACLFYWPPEARRRLEEMLLEASTTREFWRISIEPSDTFDDWQKGRPITGGAQPSATRKTGDIRIHHYRQGKADMRIVGQQSADYGTVKWLG
ncbi:MAG: DUF2332 domain-containing protein [Sphingomonadales bacterium]|nr:DUF2332 domain-containing protein [Sphingomonadales bacterium]